ncbi:MAG: potassium transporter Kup [Bdellovibrionaceae bacterium]|nr:potassium transporter Kup [Pseudobdellovibrionaceae bacterium]
MKNNQDSRIWALTFGALGIVFGDIGTSPLYAIRECFSEHFNIPVTPINILGLLSLIFWSMVLVVSIKYIFFVLRADNKGEGGILSLLALAVPPTNKTSGGRKKWIVFVGLFGAALLYGDGMITPAISVLSALEGLRVATDAFDHYIVPMTVVVLFTLFYVQEYGTSKIGFVFGPVITVYFTMLAALGIPHIITNPGVLAALNPYYGLHFLLNNGASGFWAMGSVFLVLTGCEALYADMGHFGRKPIRRAWFMFVFPALVLNYMGQGAMLLENPENIVNPFYRMAPSWALYPVVIIATLATIVASQALISGVFSLTRQAISLGFCPRMQVVHTSSEEMGQIYIPQMNWALMICTIWLVLSFKTSSNLAGAYGIAVAMTMLITTVLACYVAHRRWKWKLATTLILGAGMIGIDMVFFVANTIKIPHGGWFPLLIGGIIFTLLTTWKRGRRILAVRLREQTMNFIDFVKDECEHPVHRIPGTAVFMTSDPEMTPPALARNVQHNRVLHNRVVLLSIMTREIPRVPRATRAQVETFPDGFFRATVFFGFMESPNLNEILESLRLKDLNIEMAEITFFLGRETLIASNQRGVGSMRMWRKHLFSFMSRNAQRATQFFQIPPNQVIEIGSQIEL